MRTAFVMSKEITVITRDLQGNENSSDVERDKIDELDFPKEGTLIRCDVNKAGYVLYKVKISAEP